MEKIDTFEFETYQKKKIVFKIAIGKILDSIEVIQIMFIAPFFYR